MLFIDVVLFQLSDKSLPELHRVCPRCTLSPSFYDLVLDTPVLYDSCFSMLGLFQLSAKGIPNLHRVCPRCTLSPSFYDLVLDTLVLHDAIS